jgi:hypothetical protein
VQTNHWYVRLGAGNPDQVPGLNCKIELKLATPEILGGSAIAGAIRVAAEGEDAATENTSVLPIEFTR